MADMSNDPAKKANTELPGGVQGGVIESVKRAVIVAVRQALVGTTLDGVSDAEVTVDMEYPLAEETYPGVWVQFTFTEFMNAGLGHELIREDRDPETNVVVNWELVREFQFKGTVTLTLMALSSLHRDRLADAIVTMLMFSRPPEYVITKTHEDTKQHRGLITSLANNPYVAMTVNHDTFKPGGQAMTPGVPWDEELPGYEDNYSFDILGQTNLVFRRDGTYTLRAIDMEGTLTEGPSPFDWQ